jgi:DNA-binding LacI/PurR family transcriptional regulator/DNA-binding transcriptional regulator YhcF (GntR family)
MADPLMQFHPEQPTEVVRQAAEFVRGLIASRRLPEGKKLPTTSALAAGWGIPVASVHAALAQLVRDGLLVRQPGKGTYVLLNKVPAKDIAIYELADQLSNPESSIHRVLLGELQRQLVEARIAVHLVVDPRRGKDLAEPGKPLVRLEHEKRVGAIIAASTTPSMLPWLRKLSPVAAFGEPKPKAGGVGIDFRQMIDLCLGALSGQGCRSVGLMCGNLDRQSDFYAHFESTAKRLGLRVEERWMMPRAKRTIVPGKFHTYGYESFRAFWRQEDRPDGLMIYPDSFVPGVLLALTELGLRPPGDLQLAYHRNEGTPILNPFPATEAILREQEIAAALIAQARRLLSGEPAPPILVGFHRKDK